MTLALLLLSACASTPKPAPAPSAGPPLAGVVTTKAPAPAVQPAPALAPIPAEESKPVAGETSPSPEQGFARWVAEFQNTARSAGISDATLQRAFATVQFLPQVVELDHAQPEFSRPIWSYLDVAVSDQRVARGQDQWILERAAIDAASAQYGVPASILVAIWGIESNYGGNFGSTPVIDALATLGFDGRREEWARGQLLAALRILQAGDITPAQMIGSWAGAMGQTQFLPSVFLSYAVDADGDGRRDIWGSSADVMASTAHFLARSGWQEGQPWGTEVELPADFDFGRADGSTRLPSADWAALGVRSVDAAALPEFSDGAILLPAGARGPAFLVGPNFRVLLRYNNATSYALAVGLLAQRLDGGSAVLASWPRDLRSLSRSEVLALQTALNQRGFDSGAADGVVGSRTRDAVRRYQRSVGLPADGYPDGSLLERLASQP
ncbi:MAG: lytic murein transglycosylase [Burkholderiaceae bacterium]